MSLWALINAFQSKMGLYLWWFWPVIFLTFHASMLERITQYLPYRIYAREINPIKKHNYIRSILLSVNEPGIPLEP